MVSEGKKNLMRVKKNEEAEEKENRRKRCQKKKKIEIGTYPII